MTNATFLLHGDADSFDAAFDGDHSLGGQAFARAADDDRRSNIVVPIVAKTVEAPKPTAPKDLSLQAQTIVAGSSRRVDAGFRLVSLAKRHGFSSQEAFQCAREFLEANWSMRPQTQRIPSKIDRVAARFEATEIVIHHDWRARRRREEALRELRYNRRRREAV